MRQLRHIWFIALKDFKLFATDRGALFFFILFPFLFIILFSLMGGDSEDPRLELHLVTQEVEGGLSYQIIGAIETRDDAQLEPGEPKVVWDRDYDEARQAVENKEIDGFLSFPSDFTEGVLMGYGSQLEIVADAEAINTRAALNGFAQAIASGRSIPSGTYSLSKRRNPIGNPSGRCCLISRMTLNGKAHRSSKLPPYLDSILFVKAERN